MECGDPGAEPCEEPTPDPDVVYGVDGEWPRVVLNEVMARNHSTLADGSGRWSDWVELKNLTGEDVDIGGWSLSDDPEEPDKHVLDDHTIPAGGHLVLWADDTPALGPAHLRFSLASAGDLLGVYAPDGTTMDLLTFGAQAADVSLARLPDGRGGWELTASPSPGESNGESP